MQSILIIEDDAFIRELYDELLKDKYELDFAISGHEGFSKAISKKYDLIITDLQMDDWSGAEAMGAIDLIFENKKYIVISGYLQNPEYRTIIDSMDNTIFELPKPFQSDELLEAIEDILSHTILK